jgi:hypothetical protein
MESPQKNWPGHASGSDGERASNLGELAQQLRSVRQASRDFLLLWAFDRLLRDPQAMKRVATDVAGTSHPDETALADPFDHNWSIMYRGSVLDD